MISKFATTALVASALVSCAVALEVEAPPLIQTALEVVSRASSSSEVLTLNLTNVLILLALKVAIIAFGLFSGAATARSSSDDTSLSQVDLTGGMCFLLYTSGEDAKLDCIARSACESPVSAGKFSQAAKLWYKMHTLMSSMVPFQEKYVTILSTIDEAQTYGASNLDCSAKYNW
jgi:hypothetical protein